MGHWEYDVINQKIFWSEQVYEIHGINSDDYVPDLESAINFYHPDDIEAVKSNLADTINNKTPFKFELRILKQDTKEYLDVLCIGMPIENEVSNVTSIFGVFQDISEIKETEKELRDYKEQTELLIQAIESCQVGITLADPNKEDMPLTFVNKAFEDMTGYNRTEIIGKNCRFLQGPDTNPDPVKSIRESIKNKEELNIDLVKYHKDGKPIWNNQQI